MSKPRIEYSETGQTLTDRLESFEYIHAENKKPYRHKFTRGTHVEAEPDGSLRIFRPDGKPSWEDVNPMLFAVNTPKRRKGSRPKARRKKNRPAERRRASRPHNHVGRNRPVARHKKRRKRGHNPMAINRPKARKSGGRKRARRGHNPFAVQHMVRKVNRPRARKKGRKRGFFGHNPPATRSKRNPFLLVLDSAKLGGLVFVGKVTTGFVESFAYKIPGLQSLPAVGEAAVSVMASVIVGFIGTAVSQNVGVALMAGGFEGVYENLAMTYLPATISSMIASSTGATPVNGYARARAAAAPVRGKMNGYARRHVMSGYAQRFTAVGA